jgi:hypothetical protein
MGASEEGVMDLPFTVDQFLGVFEAYNLAIWPAQVMAYILGVAAVALAFKPSPYAGRIISAVLASFWLWNGALYHLAFFRQINPVATAFGALFIVQGVLWLLAGVVRPGLSFRATRDAPSVLGGLLILYAMVVYPIIGTQLGHGFPRSPVFGVAPCPTTIFTFGLLLWTEQAVPRRLLVIPLLWSLLGVSAATSLGIREDLGLIVASLAATTVLIWRDRHTSTGRRPALGVPEPA